MDSERLEQLHAWAVEWDQGRPSMDWERHDDLREWLADAAIGLTYHAKMQAAEIQDLRLEVHRLTEEPHPDTLVGRLAMQAAREVVFPNGRTPDAELKVRLRARIQELYDQELATPDDPR